MNHMGYFDDFLEEEAALIVSLPYRVGEWIAAMDDVAQTERDDTQERRALEKVLERMAGDGKRMPFVAAVFQECLRNKGMWAQWRTVSSSVTEDSGRAARLIAGRMPPEYARNYRKALLEVAEVVAHAYGEFMGDGDTLESEMPLADLLTKLMDCFAVSGQAGDPENVSKAERKALRELDAALQG